MARARTVFLCTECGGEAPRWMGRCPHCQAWNTLVEETLRPSKSGSRRSSAVVERAEPVRLSELAGRDRSRWTTGLSEFDFLLGGGVVPGSMVLLGGAPGIGKSTLLLQVSARLAAAGRRVLYVSGEESPHQVKLRADRLEEGTSEIRVLAETSAENVLDRVEQDAPEVLVIDSVQTLSTERVESAAGSVSQVREVAAELQRVAKARGMATFVIGHVTKGGAIAGPMTLEHIVDVVLYFESSPDLDHRVVRAAKNRFGAADEVALFRMESSGLVPVENASALFLEGRRAETSGSAVSALLEGTRTLLIEVQALATRSVYGSPQRVATGFEGRRLALLLAVLERRAGLEVGGTDIFLNVVGGLRITEPAADLAVIAALASAVRDRPVDPGAVYVGEVGLGGEVRPVGQLDRRLAEAARLGFERAYVGARGRIPGSHGLEVVRIRTIGNLIDALFT